MPAVGGHQPLDPLAADPDPVAAQLLMDPVSAIGVTGVRPDLVDVRQQPKVDLVAVTGPAFLLDPPVVGRRGDLQDP
jgi:hypothetical protein